jgi:hypothetical protein
MATAQVNGSATTVSPYGAIVEASNNHGTMRANGTSTSNIVENVTTVRPVVDTFGSTVIEDSVTSKDYAGKAVSAGTFAHNHVKPISALVTTELAGVDTNVMKSPGNDGVKRSINKVENNKSLLFTTALRANKYNRITGKWDSGYPSGQTISFSSDDAANPSLSVPGELTYRTGAKTPVNDEYASKTNG